MAIIKLSAIERRRLSAFVTCLVLAIFAWLFTSLSNPYKYTVRRVVSFRNAPQKRAFHPLQPDTVNAIVQGTGWQMLFSKFDEDKKTIDVDLRTLDVKNYVVLSAQLRQINAKREVGREIIAINPDTLFFDFSSRTVKRVPVELVTAITYQKQFSQSGNVIIKPRYVTISGPAEALNRITSWKTDTIKLNDANEDFNARVNLRGSKEGNLNVLPRSVRVNIPVDEYTEKTIEVPVKLVNNHNYYDVKIFPQKVKVTLTTSLGNYPDLNEDDFEAVADLELWRHSGYSVLPVKVTRLPSYSKVVKIEPQNIDFIIKK
ncbi:YbbR-like domain-containing protein [Mucilaginibacter terrigena]|uniref:YbbR-like domain-containing protein n=1 Tax=Mucilaginibacter terrigena TaxID=2492395 RepID=A0A4Q5LK46_9SPHI|nr:YbbR-like domain-containing protein [Mucilaginibacter terrigena]RYU89948.1 YbbR-like domain-containing protein [Mucilaginibacter terrigena]